MTHQVQNFEIHAGDDLTVTVTVKDAAGNAVDLTGATVKWQASRGTPEKFSATAVLTKVTPVASGIDITDGPGGVFQVTLASADTEGLRGAFYHEAEVTTGGSKATVMTGTLTVEATLVI